MSTPTPPPSRLLLLFLVFLLSNATHAVQLPNLVRSKGEFNFVDAFTINVLPTNTAIISGVSGNSYLDLDLDPIVRIPRERRTRGTILLVHIHPQNETVIWANAVTTVEHFAVGVAVDSNSNSYIAGETLRGFDPATTASKGVLEIAKYNRAGKLVWRTIYAPPLRSDGRPKFRIGNFDSGRTISALDVIDSSLLVVQVSRKLPNKDVPAYILFSAKTGKFLRIVNPKLPKMVNDFDPTKVVMAGTKQGPIACFSFSGQRAIATGPPRLFATCTSLKPSGAVRSNLLESLESEDDGFFHLNAAALDRSGGARLNPSFFFASERVTFPEPGKVVNELFIRRISTKTLEEVNWATGRSMGLTRPIFVSLPKRNPNRGNTHTTFQLSLDYSEKSRTVVLMFWTAVNLKNFQPENERNRKLIVRGTPLQESDPLHFWLFFVDSRRRLFPRLINKDRRTAVSYDPEKVVFSRDERFVHVYGRMNARLIVQTFRNPAFGRRM